MDLQFNDSLTIDTVFGKVKTVYVPQAPDEIAWTFKNEKKVIPSHYRAVVLDGCFNGWYAVSEGSRDTAVAKLLSDVAERYAADTVAAAIVEYEK